MFRNAPSRKKIAFPINAELRQYLEKAGREQVMPIRYERLLRFETSVALRDHLGKDTYWQTVYYNAFEMSELHDDLTRVYSLLKADGDTKILEHLSVARVDFCTFGNTQPFRIRIVNRYNDNYDHFYVKRADASRVYGLELEHILSPNRITYFTSGDTIIEEHIAGIPGHDFIERQLDDTLFNQTRIAKEFVKFNERCFIRLLGDMRSYNYVVDITPDIEGSQFRLRAIDFDQQSYEGHKNFYLPQYFKENKPIIFMGMQRMKPSVVRQYQLEERAMTAARIKAAGNRLPRLFQIMMADTISTLPKVYQLREELAKHHSNPIFLRCETMGQIVSTNLNLILENEFKDAFWVE